MFTIYTKAGGACKFCNMSKALLDRTNHLYQEQIVGVHIIREDFLSLFPDAKSFPVIIHEGNRIGGYEELVGYLKQVGPGQELLQE